MMNLKVFPMGSGSTCENALICFFDLTAKEIDLYRDLLRNGPSTAAELGDRICRDRSTAYRAVTDLVNCGLVEKVKKVQEGGGIYHVYQAVEPEMVQEMLMERIETWHDQMLKAVSRTRDELTGSDS
ncbi:MAG: helix-turn-helix domain-containing protein [Thermoplasmatota archaeon]